MKSSEKKSPVILSPIRAVTESVGQALSSAGTSVTVRRALVSALWFLFSLAVSGVEVFPGTYPLGLAALSSVTGFFPTLASFVGATISSLRINNLRGVYLFVYTCLFLLRLGTSVWLSSGKKDSPPLYDRIKNTDSARALFSVVRDYFTKDGVSLMRENIRVRLAVSAVSALFAGAWTVVEGGYVYYDLFGALFSLVTVPVFTYLFHAAASKNMRTRRSREIGIYFVCAAVALSLHSLSVLPISSDASLAELGIVSHGFAFDFGALAAFAATVLVSLGYGTHRGVLCGLICGAVLTPLYAPAYAIAAIACGILSDFSPTFAVLFSSTLACAWGIYVGGFDGMALLFPPIVVGCALVIPAYRFGLIKFPDDLFLPLSSDRRANVSTMAEVSYNDMRRRVRDISDGLCSISSVLDTISKKLATPDKADMREIVGSVFTFHCQTCKRRDSCSEARTAEENGETILTRKMADSLSLFGAVSADIVPTSLASECYNIGRILDEINLTASHKIASLADGDRLSVTADDYALAGMLIGSAAKNTASIGEIDTALSSRLARLISREDFSASSVTAFGERRKYIFVDGVDVNSAKLGADDLRVMFEEATGCRLTSPDFRLDGASLSMEMCSVPCLSCKYGSYSCATGEDDTKKSPSVTVSDEPPADICGDVIRTFETDGVFYILLSDGMGTGKEAALTSGIVASMLERLILSGADLECALKMLNQIIRQTGRECSATVDIASIDLMTGEARFVKSGAAPSFVIRDGSIFRLQSKTVPIGIIRALDAEKICFDIRDGDTVVMLSDGAARSYDEVPWLLDMMTHDEDILSGDEEKAAEKIVREARRRGSNDDITAGIVRIMSLR